MAFYILRHLQYGPNSNSANILDNSPSRILPLTFLEEISENNVKDKLISFTTARLNKINLLCDSSYKVPEPIAYFSGKHSFLKSFLYLTSIDYYKNCHLPKKADEILHNYIKNLLMDEKGHPKSKNKCKKLLQNVLTMGKNTDDTDPFVNPLFNTLFDFIKEKILIIKCDNNGYYHTTVPKKIPNLTSEETENICYILLQLPNNKFSPYGKTYYKK
jgi:hypothetical protein